MEREAQPNEVLMGCQRTGVDKKKKRERKQDKKRKQRGAPQTEKKQQKGDSA